MRTMQRVVVSIAAASGLVAVVGVILTSRLERCDVEWEWRSALAQLFFPVPFLEFDPVASLSVALAATIGCAVAALVIGASLDVRRGIASTAILVAAVTTAAMVGSALGLALIGCETMVTGNIRTWLLLMGVASLVGAVLGYLVGLGVATIVARRSRLA